MSVKSKVLYESKVLWMRQVLFRPYKTLYMKSIYNTELVEEMQGELTCQYNT